MRHCMPHAFI